MSNTTLNQLLDKHAFDGSPLHVDMPAYHVPFDDEQRTGTESGVVRAAESSERLGVQGPIGCGKTSLLRYALDDPGGATAPIWVSVAFDVEITYDKDRQILNLAATITPELLPDFDPDENDRPEGRSQINGIAGERFNPICDLGPLEQIVPSWPA